MDLTYTNLNKPIAEINGIKQIFNKNELSTLQKYGILTVEDFVISSYYYSINNNTFNDIFDFFTSKVTVKRFSTIRIIKLFLIFKKELNWVLNISNITKSYLLRPYYIKSCEDSIDYFGLSVDDVIKEIGYIKEIPIINKELANINLLDLEDFKNITGSNKFIKAGVKTIHDIMEINAKEIINSNAKRDFFFAISGYLSCGPVTILKLICLLYAQGYGFMQIGYSSRLRINRSVVLKNINLLEKHGIYFNKFAEHYKLKSKSK